MVDIGALARYKATGQYQLRRASSGEMMPTQTVSPGEPDIVRAFLAMRAVENVLRELIVDELGKAFGPRWHKTQLPEDVGQKFRDAIAVERRYPWLHMVPHHPIYYIDFPDLKKVIIRNDNWTNAFLSVFGRNKDIILSMFTELEPLRNSIAHSRVISAASIDIIETASERLRTALGPNRFDAILVRTTVAPNVYQILCRLRQEADVASDRLRHCQPSVVIDIWLEAKDRWWFEDSYLGADLEPIRAFFRLAHDYDALSRSMGDGYRVERWLAERHFDELASTLRASWEALKIMDA